MRFPNFCEGTHRSAISNFQLDRCINMYVETAKSGANAKENPSLVRPAGLGGTVVTLPDDPVRCLWAGEGGRVFAVAGAKYGEIVAGAFQDRGTLAEDSAAAIIVSNGNQLLIYSAGKAYYDNGGAATGSNAVLITVADASSVAYIDGYGVITEKDTNNVFISGLLDFSTWNALDVQERTSRPDRLLRAIEHGGNLWLFGRASIEQWYNSGNADYPFEPVRGSTIDVGTFFPDSIAKAGGELCFIGHPPEGGSRAYRTRGSNLERISPQGLESYLVGGAPVGWAFDDRGHSFYVVNQIGSSGVPSHVYDITEDRWWELGHWTGSAYDPYLGRCHCFNGNDHLVGARNSGKVYVQSIAYEQFDATDIRAQRVVRFPSAEDKYQFHHRFELDVETGTQSAGTPDATLDWSDDGGSTYSTARTMSLGPPGNRTIRAYANRLGRSRSRIYRVTLAQGGKTRGISGAFINVKEGVV